MAVEFIGEPGLDAGGLTREWLLEVSKELFSPSLGLFHTTADATYMLNPASGQHRPRDHLQLLLFAGRVVGKALLERMQLNTHLALPLLKHLLEVPVTLSDLEFVDPSLYQSIEWLRNNNGAEALCLDFTVAYEGKDGKPLTFDLAPDGGSVDVTDANKEQYVQLAFAHRMLGGVREQLQHFRAGLYEVVPLDLLCVFDYQELDLLLCGVPSIDVSDWKAHTTYLGVYANRRPHKPHKVIRWFWEVVEAFSDEEKAKLLQFVTGTSQLPAQGFRALQSNDGQLLQFHITSLPKSISLFPRAHTCFNRIDLPLYSSRSELEAYLTLVINMEVTGFSME